MTLSPNDDRNIVGLDGPKYELNEFCPVCGLEATERHHIWRRSAIAGDRWYVYVPTLDTVFGNCVKLCNEHHHELTIHYARLELDLTGLYWTTQGVSRRKLKWLPPAYVADDGLKMAIALGVRHFEPQTSSEGIEWLDGPTIDPLHGARDHDPSVCYACKRRIPQKKDKTEEKKIRKTWSIAVPVDKREDGADVLDTLIEEARREMFDAGLPYGSEDTAKFHVLAAALGLFVLHAQGLMSES